MKAGHDVGTRGALRRRATRSQHRGVAGASDGKQSRTDGARSAKRTGPEADQMGRSSKRSAVSVDKIKTEIGSEASGKCGEALKQYLRSLQLRWHPDKNSGEETDSAEVFRFVQDLWQTAFQH